MASSRQPRKKLSGAVRSSVPRVKIVRPDGESWTRLRKEPRDGGEAEGEQNWVPGLGVGCDEVMRHCPACTARLVVIFALWRLQG